MFTYYVYFPISILLFLTVLLSPPRSSFFPYTTLFRFGSIVGLWLPSWVDYLKPLGDIFLNLLFVSIIPLLFFAITSSVANIEGENKLGKTIGIMGSVFLITIVIASAATVIALYLFPVNAGMAP